MRALDLAVRKLLDYFPHYGSYLGLREYDFKVPELTKKRIEEFVSWSSECASRLREWEPENEELEADRDELVRSLELHSLIEGGWRPWRHYPIAPSAASELLLSVILSPAPEDHKERALRARLKALPKLFEESKELLEEPKSLWVQLARAELQGLKLLLVNINAPDEAKRAVEEYDRWLDSLEPEEGFRPIGEELFKRLLQIRYIKMSAEELERTARKRAEELREELGEAPEGKEVEDPKEAYEEAVRRAKSFVVERRLAPLAYDEELEIIDTPEPLRPTIPYAAYMPPQAFAPFNLGYLLVTPGSAKKEYYEILNTAVHETYPGHHLQLSYPLPTKYRHLASATDFVEGWAHYAEELMLEEGFSEEPRYVWQVKKDMLWRWVRVYVDVGISTGRMSFEEAVKELVEVAMLDERSASSEALRYTLSPGYQLSYAYGKMRIKEMRELMKEVLGSAFSLYDFHSWLLGSGALPVDLLKERLEA
ncbi:MAG: DUF885 domain-containing protein [Crenarchaeota archaeon]|nr:DUF885 domain-containing protein [Thermoproteota archaeon]